ncbi:MAG: hypothetical protein L0216_10470 [Planctomycetales bacterium]|nr:hypothetical protein [Planctomycetales bacterium]
MASLDPLPASPPAPAESVPAALTRPPGFPSDAVCIRCGARVRYATESDAWNHFAFCGPVCKTKFQEELAAPVDE